MRRPLHIAGSFAHRALHWTGLTTASDADGTPFRAGSVGGRSHCPTATHAAGPTALGVHPGVARRRSFPYASHVGIRCTQGTGKRDNARWTIVVCCLLLGLVAFVSSPAGIVAASLGLRSIAALVSVVRGDRL